MGITAKNLYLAFKTVVLDTDFRSFSGSETGELADQTAGADANHTYITTVKDGTFTTTILIQASDTTTWGAVAVHGEGTLEWAEEGTTATYPRHYVNAIVTDRTKSGEYAGVVVADITWQMSGAVTDTTY